MAPVASSVALSPPPPDNSAGVGTFLQFDVMMSHQQEQPQQEEEEQQRYQRKMRSGDERTTITIPTNNNTTGYNSSSYSTSSSSTSSNVSSPSFFASGYAPCGGAASASSSATVSTEFSLSASELLASMSPLSATNDAPLHVFMESYKSRAQQDEVKLQVVPQAQQPPPVKPKSPMPLRKNLSPKRERGTNSTAAASTVDASSSSQHEEDSLSSDSSTAKKVFKCTFPGCGKEFHLKGNLKRHQNIHNGDKKFRCKFCGKDFLRKADMEVHHRVHTGEKPYKCKFADCDKCFARRSDLLSHERTHVGTKPFACLYPGCERHFARKFDLQKHQRMHDNHSSECQKRRKISSPSSDDCNCWPAAPLSPMIDESASADLGPLPVPAAPAIPAPQSTSTASTSVFFGPPRYQQLTCTQDHIHSPPACFAAFTPDLLDNFLLSSRDVFDTKPYPGCCDSIGDGGDITAGHPHHHHSSSHTHPNIKQQFEALVIGDEPIITKTEFPAEVSQSTSSIQQPATGSSPSATAAKRPRSASASSSSSSTSSCPIDAELLKDYAKHTPSCGHLSIMHGNHRDYVVKNHLVCQDSVRSIGGGENHSVKPAKCPVDEPHRPGCGHLPVRHRDHIDYVVEDNLFCQQAAGMLDASADNIELLGDDFWEFYGAIGSLN